MMPDKPFMVGVTALMVVIVAIGALLIWGEVRETNQCRASRGHEVVTGLIIIKGIPYDQYTCEH